MKQSRVWLLVGLVVMLMGVALYWWRMPRGFATPADCMEAYREALLAGDTPGYLDCLAEPLRSQAQATQPDPEALKARVSGLKGWTQAEEADGTGVLVRVDEVRRDGTRRVCYRLEQSAGGWLIARIDPPQKVPTPIPYGTHIGKVLGEGTKQD